MSGKRLFSQLKFRTMSKTAVYTLTEIRNKIYAKSREKERAGEWFLPQV
jgi:hypothetical protein